MDIFSEREQKIIKILGRRPMTLEEISSKLFQGNPDKPFDDKIAVGNSVRRIIAKCKHHNLEWTLEKSRETFPMTVRKCNV